MNLKRILHPFRAPAVLAVCSGNTCRSAMAEYLIRDRFRTGRVWSRGTGAMAGDPMAVYARIVVEDLTGDEEAGGQHQSRALQVADVRDADVVVAMTPGHAMTVARLARTLPVWARPQIVTLAIEDPIGGTLDRYRATATAILRQVADRAGLRAKGIR